MNFQEYYNFGHILIEAAVNKVEGFWKNKTFSAEYKEDASPVTEVDRQCELLLRDLICKKYPSHGVIGEEYGTHNSESEFQWTIDPVDGTQSLVNHIPTFCVLIGLKFREKPVLGFIHHPALNIYCHGGSNLGVFYNGERQCPLAKAETFGINDIISMPSYFSFKKYKALEIFHDVMEAFPYSRLYYDNFAGSLMCKGSLAAMLDLGKEWDVLPVHAMIAELGGAIKKTALTDSKDLWICGRENVVDALLQIVKRVKKDG